MASAWGLSWAGSWGGSWGAVSPPGPTPGPTYMRAPSIEDDEPKRMTTMQIAIIAIGADLSGLSADSKN